MGKRYQTCSAGQPFDPSARFVRLREVRSDGFVEFDFAIGEPELSVELILPVAKFHEFCRANHVTHITPIDSSAIVGESPRGTCPDA